MRSDKPKIMFFANTDWFLYQFNLGMAKHLQENGFDVIFISPLGSYQSIFEASGVRSYTAPFSRATLNLWKDIKFLFWLFLIIRKERPEILHNFTIKCVVYGTLIGRIAGVKKCVNEFTGLGYIFTANTFKAKFYRRIATVIFKKLLGSPNDLVVVLNQRDFRYIQGVLPKFSNNVRRIAGVGVDCEKFSMNKQRKSRPFRVLLPARILKDKGVCEYVRAAKFLKTKCLDIQFYLAGKPDPGNPSSISDSDIHKWQIDGILTWLGHCERIEEIYSIVNVVILPSYREGLPTSLTEAAACGLPLIATSVPGCEDVVFDRINGILIPVEDHSAIVVAVLELYHNSALCERMGIASRVIAEKYFSTGVVFKSRLGLYAVDIRV
jgi:glycosyltransferase involved in cell wall biosynthesis